MGDTGGPKLHDARSWLKRSAAGSDGAEGAVALPDVRIQFCGSWGYRPRYVEAEAILKKEFPGIRVTDSEDVEATGNFEIFAGTTLVHSKQRGDGFVDTPAKVRALVEAVGSVSGGAVELEQGLVVVDADQVEGEEDEEPPSNASLCFSLFTLAVSIPALIGAWCWPALVVTLVSGTVSGFARTLGHWISLAVTGLLMIVVNVFMARGLKHRYIPLDEGQGCMGRRCQKYGPLILTLVASPLIMADLMRHVLGDVGAWPWCGDPSVQGGVFPRINESWSDACFWSSTEYRCNIPCCVPGNNTVQGANDYDLNYLLRTNATDGTNVQLPFSEFCGMDADGNVVPIEGATHTNPNCTCAMGACDPDKAPADQMAVLAVGDASLRLLAPLEPGQQQDTNYPQGFANDPQRADTFAPYWPAYPQLDAETLAYVKSEAVKGNPDVAPEDIPDCNCLNCVPADQENIHHLSFIGVLFTIIFTYTGFIMLAVGTLWNANIIKKCGEIKQQWRQLRRQREAIAGRKKRRVVSGFSSTDDKVAPLLGGSRKE